MKYHIVFFALYFTSLSVLAVNVDADGFQAGDGFKLDYNAKHIHLEWPADKGRGYLKLAFNPKKPLIQSLGIRGSKVMSDLDPQYIFWVGQRDLAKRKGWNIFFDRVPTRAYSAEKAVLTPTAVAITRKQNRAAIEIQGLASPNFTGSLLFMMYSGSPFIRMEARVSTTRPATAFLYHCGLSKKGTGNLSLQYIDALGAEQNYAVDNTPARTLKTKYRTVTVSSNSGSLSIMPAPHQFLYPLDFAENYGYNWAGVDYLDFVPGFSWGIRQPPIGDKRFVPWVNAPEAAIQKLAAFMVISDQAGDKNLNKVKSYTRSDTFKKLPGYKTFTSHYHVEHALDYIDKQRSQGNDSIPSDLRQPEFVDEFKQMGVDIVHLAEFHKRATPSLPTMARLQQLKVMHDECARLSDDRFLLLPGEEPNVHLGGHWLSFFPKPVNWVLNRPAGQPFVQEIEGFGTVYHVGSVEDVRRLMQKEQGLMWTAHARIKSSTGYPDQYKDTAFFRSDRFLGAAWKAMPADYSRDTLGWRVIDLLDDMSNWGNKKYIIGEVDVFKIFRGYELYGAMNINYLKMNALPKYQDGWRPVLDAIRSGSFFVTTGEILIPRATIGGKEAGQTLPKSPKLKKTRITAKLEWTFPLSHAEIVSGDGSKVYRHRVDLADTREFGSRTVKLKLDLSRRTWARLEVWDIAANGAFTQPVWIE